MTNRSPLLSIIIPVYNSEKYLIKCLESVIQQTYKNIEVIIVNDCSKGNVEEIVEEYKKIYKNIKLVNHQKNHGVFKARVTGVENCAGEYIAFLNSDDKVSIDYYRLMIHKALETGSDMVACDFLLEHDDGRMEYCNLANLNITDINLKGQQISDAFFNQNGLDYSWTVVWNKIYSKRLWQKCYIHIKNINENLITNEDIVFSSIFYCFCEKYTNVHNAYYIHCLYCKSNLKESDDLKKHIVDVKKSFEYVKRFLKDINKDVKYDKVLDKWKENLLLKLSNLVSDSSINRYKKRNLMNLIKESSQVEWDKEDEADVDFFCKHNTVVENFGFEDIKKAIGNEKCEYVSFDVFDTLVVRPFWEPYDLFEFLDIYATKQIDTIDKLHFKHIRIEAEQRARDKKRMLIPSQEDVTFDEIYDEIYSLGILDKDIITKIKEEEIRLELKYCYQRKTGKELYELAKYLGKKVICISDMYLDKKTIKQILDKNGYYAVDEIFVSSEINLTKASGRLYKYALRELKIKKAKSVVHIGDNYWSDVENARNSGLLSFHLPKSGDMFANRNPGIYSGEYFNKIFSNNTGIMDNEAHMRFVGTRCMLAVVANKIFDNPYVYFNRNSDFNANPYFIGYFTLGMHTFAIANWLFESIKDNKYKNINFMARDGYLTYKAFNEFAQRFKLDVVSNYVYFSRKAILPIMINKEEDMLSLVQHLNIKACTPHKFINLFKVLIDNEKIYDAKNIIGKNGFEYDAKFNSITEFNTFVKIFMDNFYDKDLYEKYKCSLGKYIQQFFSEKSATFDVGYSCRIESILKKKFGYDITPHYVHINNDIPCFRAKYNDINIKVLYEYTPAITGVLREQIISDLAASCVGYIEEEEQMVPVFEEEEWNYQTEFITTTMQNAALEFVRDFLDIFETDMDKIYFRPQDVSAPMEYYLHYAKNFDRQIFASTYFEDDLGIGKSKIRVSDFWNNQTMNISQQYNNEIKNYYSLSKVKKFIYLFIFNRNMLKQKVKTRYSHKPKFIKCLKCCYNVLRKIKHIYSKLIRVKRSKHIVINNNVTFKR